MTASGERASAAPAGMEAGMRQVVAGRYRLVRKLAEGGMGSVFIAEHTLSRKRMALKVVHPYLCRGRQGVERFRREVSAAAQIDHPGIVQVFDAGVDDDGGFFMAMELLRGESIGDRLRREWPGMATAVGWIEGMLAPLAKAHEKNFVHRDLKPDNVFLALDEDGNERLKLLDFGLAREVSKGGPTRTGITFGTPEYMSPEQAMSARKVRAPGDVWSVGVMLYELLSGEHPFTGETPNAIMANAIKEPLPPLRDKAPHVPPELATVVERALEKEPEDRPQTAGELLEELRAVVAGLDLDETVPEAPTPPPRWDDESEEPPFSSDFPIRPRQAEIKTHVEVAPESSEDAAAAAPLASVVPSQPPMNRTPVLVMIGGALLVVVVLLSGAVYWVFSAPEDAGASGASGASGAQADPPEPDTDQPEPDDSALELEVPAGQDTPVATVAGEPTPTTPTEGDEAAGDPSVDLADPGSTPGARRTRSDPSEGEEGTGAAEGGSVDAPPPNPFAGSNAVAPPSNPFATRRRRSAEQIAAARACPDTNCAIEALHGVRSATGLHMLIGLYRRAGRMPQALDSSERFIQRYGSRPEAAQHRAFLTQFRPGSRWAQHE